jgi:hypothetical protein
MSLPHTVRIDSDVSTYVWATVGSCGHTPSAFRVSRTRLLNFRIEPL